MTEDTVTQADLARLENKIDALLECVNGNGKPGLKTDIAIIKDWQARHEATHAQLGRDWRAILWPLASAGVGAALGWLVLQIATATP